MTIEIGARLEWTLITIAVVYLLLRAYYLGGRR